MKNSFGNITPVMTEKSSLLQSKGQYVFKVDRSTTKIDVKNAVKELYGADVKSVKMMVIPGKTRIVGRGQVWTKRPVTKRAIVTLKGKKTIDPNKPFESKKK